MKNMWRLIRRFVFILLTSIILLFVLNIVLLIKYTYNEANNRGGWQSAEEIGEEITGTKAGGYQLSAYGMEILRELDAWGILIEDETGDVVWKSDNLPPDIPLHYSAAEISWGTRGYIKDYPTTTGSRGKDLVILGHPKKRYWKQMWNMWSYELIAGAPQMAVKILGFNMLAVILIYIISTSGILRSVKPIVEGIEALSEEKEVYVRERGLLSGLGASINKTSEKLMRQKYDLKKKEHAQENWIAGVSHDIRTPLSMVMGYAGQLEDNTELPEEARKQAQVIRLESVRMKNLIHDLNLYSKLEYNMQPLKRTQVNLLAVLRLAAADFMNLDLEQKYSVEWEAAEETPVCIIEGDKELLGRAVNNLLTNIRVHNPEGCRIHIEIRKKEDKICISIQDDGAGVTEEQMERLQNTPHYMLSDGSSGLKRHGMGLLIVKQIMEAHGGTVEFGSGIEGRGFGAELKF